MPATIRRRLLACSALSLATVAPPTGAQQPAESDILEIPVETRLVRIDVVVSDRDGRPVAGLTRDDFEVREDGQPQEILQFEAFERDRLRPPHAADEPERPAGEGYRRRYIVLALDDLHIDPGNLSQAKRAMSRFVERELGPEDQAAVVATSGSSGLYQEFTSDADTLRRAIDRVTPQVTTSGWIGVPDISQYQAELIERGDPLALEMAVQEILREEPPGADPEAAARRALNRARMIRAESSHFVRQTLETLDAVMRGLADLPGRKVLVLVSDGFLMGLGTSDQRAFDLRRITDAGTRAGVVVYGLDTRGLVASPPVGNAASRSVPSPMAPGLRERINRDAEGAVRDGMNGLAEGTGGFLVHSANDLLAGLDRILGDTETYYLLAYRPTSTRHDGRFRRIQVRLPGRDRLKARTRRGYFAPDEKEARVAPAPDAEEGGRRAADELRLALSSLYPRQAIPLRLAADFVSLGDAGLRVVVNGNVDLKAVRFRRLADRYLSTLVIAGVIYDARGLPVADLEPRLANLSLTRSERDLGLKQGLKYYEVVSLPAGAYEVRLAVRDDAGRLGSASRRVDLPDPADGLFLGGPFLLRAEGGPGGVAGAAPPRLRDVHAFPRFLEGESLYYQLQVLTPDGGAGEAALTIRAHVIQAGVIRASTTERPLALQQGGAFPMTYTGRIGLAPLPAGEYELQVQVTDHGRGETVQRSIGFNLDR